MPHTNPFSSFTVPSTQGDTERRTPRTRVPHAPPEAGCSLPGACRVTRGAPQAVLGQHANAPAQHDSWGFKAAGTHAGVLHGHAGSAAGTAAPETLLAYVPRRPRTKRQGRRTSWCLAAAIDTTAPPCSVQPGAGAAAGMCAAGALAHMPPCSVQQGARDSAQLPRADDSAENGAPCSVQQGAQGGVSALMTPHTEEDIQGSCVSDGSAQHSEQPESTGQLPAAESPSATVQYDNTASCADCQQAHAAEVPAASTHQPPATKRQSTKPTSHQSVPAAPPSMDAMRQMVQGLLDKAPCASVHHSLMRVRGRAHIARTAHTAVGVGSAVCGSGQAGVLVSHRPAGALRAAVRSPVRQQSGSAGAAAVLQICKRAEHPTQSPHDRCKAQRAAATPAPWWFERRCVYVECDIMPCDE